MSLTAEEAAAIALTFAALDDERGIHESLLRNGRQRWSSRSFPPTVEVAPERRSWTGAARCEALLIDVDV